MKPKYGALAAATTIPFILIGGAYLAFAYFNRGSWRRKPNPRVRKRSVSMAALHGGRIALQRLVDYQEARADTQKLNAAEYELNDLLQQEYIDFPRMQRIVAKLEMSGNEAKAVQILREEKLKALKEGKAHEAYEIEMLLVEMFIYKGEFQNAFSCKCLNEEKISDARRHLFKAIIIIALERPRYEELGKQCWERFNEVREDFDDPPSFKESVRESLEGNGFYKLATSFNEFEKVVKRLKDDIQKAHSKKNK
ncbi:Transmembrane protein [Trema orientale]|uniref:Transmembrane protein n=1 Tax=Trema orientale TaxID=63057 RepID=A0A2P5B4N2_TREOI|nr:Transmembrane protein [Trema orientale]